MRLALAVSLSVGSTLGVAALPAYAATLTLSVSTQPGGAIPASPFGSQPVVAFTPATSGADTLSAQLADSTGAPITSTTVAQLSAGSPCAVNKCTVGVAGGATSQTFSGLAIDRAGTYKLIFALEPGGADTGAGFATSSTFTVGTGIANQLVLDSPVAGAARARPLNVQPKVSLNDAGLNVITTNSSDSVSLQLIDANTMNPPTNGATVSGSTNATFSQGIATFSGLSISQPGDYLLRANSSAGTASLDIKGPKYSFSSSAPDAPIFVRERQLVIQSGPSSGRAGQVLDPLVVQLTDSNGSVQNSTESIVVHLTRKGVDLPFTFAGATTTTATVALIAGVANVSGVIIPAASGVGAYNFVVEAAASNTVNTRAQAGNLGSTAPAAGASFRLSDRQLLFTVQPSPSDAGKPMTRNPVVSLLDGAGNPVSNSSDQVRIAFGGSTSAKLGGQGCAADGKSCVLTMLNGAAVFAGLSVDQPGTYTLTASTSAVDSAGNSIPSVTSESFSVTGAAAAPPSPTAQPPAPPAEAPPAEATPAEVTPPADDNQPEASSEATDEEMSDQGTVDEGAPADEMAPEASDASPSDEGEGADEASSEEEQ
ncbi:MAG TPA: hypothetical protein VGK54_15985 [Chloroflexota bacterium]